MAHEAAPVRVTKGMARHPIPVMWLARLATDLTWQGKGVGAALLADAMRRTLQAADIAGIRALVAHAKDDKARRFYQHFDFDPSPKEPLAPFDPHQGNPPPRHDEPVFHADGDHHSPAALVRLTRNRSLCR